MESSLDSFQRDCILPDCGQISLMNVKISPCSKEPRSYGIVEAECSWHVQVLFFLSGAAAVTLVLLLLSTLNLAAKAQLPNSQKQANFQYLLLQKPHRTVYLF